VDEENTTTSGTTIRESADTFTVIRLAWMEVSTHLLMSKATR